MDRGTQAGEVCLAAGGFLEESWLGKWSRLEAGA